MIAKLDYNTYIDIDSIRAITGDYTSEKPDEWTTQVVLDGPVLEYKGQMGREVLNAYLLKVKHYTYDYVTGSPTYKKALK